MFSNDTLRMLIAAHLVEAAEQKMKELYQTLTPSEMHILVAKGVHNQVQNLLRKYTDTWYGKLELGKHMDIKRNVEFIKDPVIGVKHAVFIGEILVPYLQHLRENAPSVADTLIAEFKGLIREAKGEP